MDGKISKINKGGVECPVWKIFWKLLKNTESSDSKMSKYTVTPVGYSISNPPIFETNLSHHFKIGLNLILMLGMMINRNLVDLRIPSYFIL